MSLTLKSKLAVMILSFALCGPAIAETALTPLAQALERKEFESAIKEALKALGDKKNKEKKNTLYYQLGLGFYGSKLYGLALEAFKNAEDISDNPESKLFYYMAWSAYLNQDLALSQTYIEKALPNIPPELEASAKELSEALLKERNTAYQKGLQAYESKQYRDAITHLKEALKTLPDRQEITLTLGASHYILSEFEEAKVYLNSTIEKDPQSPSGEKAQEFLNAIDTLNNRLVNKPFKTEVTFGPLLNTNLNLGGSLRADSTEQALTGNGGQINLNMAYQFWPDTNINYILDLKGYLNNTETPLNPSRYNRQLHTLSVNSSYFVQDIYQVQLATSSSVDLLGTDVFLTQTEFHPRLTIFATDRLLSQVGISFAAGIYPTVASWSHTRLGIDLSQYIYLWNSKTWLRFFYQHQNINALDDIDKTFNQTTRIEVESRRANSRKSHQIGLSFQAPLLAKSTFEMGSYFTFTDYTKSEVHREFPLINDPRTGLNLPRRNELGQSFEQLRRDTHLNFYATLNVPLDEHWSLKGQYRRLTNVSNILPHVIPGRNYNYLLDELGLSVKYVF